MKPTLPLCRLVLLLLSASAAQAQTATWIAPANGSANGSMSWLSGPNWDTGAVPDGPAAVAVFTQRENLPVAALTGTPGSANALIDGASITLDAVRYALPENPGGGQITNLSLVNGSRLVLQGDGIVLGSVATYGISQRILVDPTSQLVLAGTAQVRTSSATPGELLIVLSSDRSNFIPRGAVLRLQDTATLGPARVTGGSTFDNLAEVEFANASSAGSGSITLMHYGGVVFLDRSSAGAAQIAADTIAFLGTSSAGNARLTPTNDIAGSSISFRDHSTAANATILLGKLGDVWFRDDADAGTATVSFGAGSAGNRVVIQDNARTSGLSISAAQGGYGRLDIAGANQDVRLRALDGSIDVNLGPRSLRFDDPAGPASFTLSGRISGSGGLIWDRGSGTLTVTNPDNDFTGVTRIYQGNLVLTQGRLGETQVSSGVSSLSGTGMIAGTLSNSGTVLPGPSSTATGSIRVQGNYVQTAGGALVIRIVSAADYARLIVSGSATLTGRLSLSAGKDVGIVGNTAIDFLTASGVSGQFSAVGAAAGPGVMLPYQLQYTASGVRLQFTQRSFAGLGTTPSAVALGANLDATLAGSAGDYRALVATLNTLEADHLVSAALGALTPDRYAALAENGVLDALARQGARARRFDALRSGPHEGLGLSFEAVRRATKFAATAGLPAADSTLDGGSADLTWSRGAYSLGASLEQGNGKVTLDALGSRADLKGLTPTVSFQYAGAGLFLNGSAGLGRDDYRLRRRIVYAGSDQTATASPAGRHTALALATGYVVHSGPWSFTPEAGLLRSDWSVDDFAETGAPGANLSVQGWSARSLDTRIAFTAAAAGRVFRPRLNLSWWHAVSQAGSLHAAFAGGTPYAAPGRDHGRDWLQASLACDWPLGRGATLGATVAAMRGKNAATTGDVSASLRWEF
jgi:autotransporter-associated beta strand protein